MSEQRKPHDSASNDSLSTPEAGPNDLPKAVRYHRKKSRLTQIELAKLAGVGKTAIFDLEKGKQTIQLDTLLKILHVLNIRIVLRSPIMGAFFRDRK